MKYPVVSLVAALAFSAMVQGEPQSRRFAQANPEVYQKMMEGQIKNMANDKAFKRLSREVDESFLETDKQIGKLSESEQKLLDTELTQFIENTRKHNKIAKKSERLRKILPLQNQAQEVNADLGHLAGKYPLVRSPAAINETYYESKGIEYGFNDTDPDRCDKVDCDCLDECDAKFRRLRNEAGLNWWAQSLAGLLNPITVAIESAQLAQELNRLRGRELDCRAKCLGLESFDECKANKDCPAGQWCRVKDPINLCSPKLIEGQNCGASYECKTGCCKYNLWANPFHKVCRPSSKCD